MKVQIPAPLVLLAALAAACEEADQTSLGDGVEPTVLGDPDVVGELNADPAEGPSRVLPFDEVSVSNIDELGDHDPDESEDEPEEEPAEELVDSCDAQEAIDDPDAPCAGLIRFDDPSDPDALRVCAALERIDELEVYRVGCVVPIASTTKEAHDFTTAELADRIEELAEVTEEAVEDFDGEWTYGCYDTAEGEGACVLDYWVRGTESQLDALEIVGIQDLLEEAPEGEGSCSVYATVRTSERTCDNLTIATAVLDAYDED